MSDKMTDEIRPNPFIGGGLAELRHTWPQSHVVPGQYGDYLVVVPGVLLQGYDHTICTVLFVAPAGFPGACPQHFWTDTPELHLTSGGRPHKTNTLNPPSYTDWPEWRAGTLWWGWRLQAWNPNHDSLPTYMRVVKRRLAMGRDLVSANET